jgi:hypothetical protein
MPRIVLNAFSSRTARCSGWTRCWPRWAARRTRSRRCREQSLRKGRKKQKRRKAIVQKINESKKILPLTAGAIAQQKLGTTFWKRSDEGPHKKPCFPTDGRRSWSRFKKGSWNLTLKGSQEFWFLRRPGADTKKEIDSFYLKWCWLRRRYFILCVPFSVWPDSQKFRNFREEKNNSSKDSIFMPFVWNLHSF